MVSLSAVTTPTINPSPNREQSPVRDDAVSREKQPIVQPLGSRVAQSDTDSQKNYQQQQDFASTRAIEPSQAQGNRRGSLLDLTV